jgi:hypothetical protein
VHLCHVFAMLMTMQSHELPLMPSANAQNNSIVILNLEVCSNRCSIERSKQVYSGLATILRKLKQTCQHLNIQTAFSLDLHAYVDNILIDFCFTAWYSFLLSFAVLLFCFQWIVLIRDVNETLHDETETF